jgi:hypothetical protein
VQGEEVSVHQFYITRDLAETLVDLTDHFLDNIYNEEVEQFNTELRIKFGMLSRAPQVP